MITEEEFEQAQRLLDLMGSATAEEVQGVAILMKMVAEGEVCPEDIPDTEDTIVLRTIAATMVAVAGSRVPMKALVAACQAIATVNRRDRGNQFDA